VQAETSLTIYTGDIADRATTSFSACRSSAHEAVLRDFYIDEPKNEFANTTCWIAAVECVHCNVLASQAGTDEETALSASESCRLRSRIDSPKG